MSEAGWSIEELVERVATALGGAGVPAPNGRVTAVPDRRVIRWYATIGLLDRPLRAGGRSVRYGQRHLLQLMAVKRRQAEGRSLTEIQAELAGATDATLRRVAGLPEVPDGPAAQEPPRLRFWAEPPAPAHPAHVAPQPVYPLVLLPGATLVLSAQPRPDDLAAIQEAARPLLDLLARRGLLTDRAQEES